SAICSPVVGTPQVHSPPLPLPEDHGATMLAPSHAAAQLASLLERDPIGRRIALAAEQEDIDAPVPRSSDVAGLARLRIPGLLPGNRPSLKLFDDAISNDVVDAARHFGTSFRVA